MISRDTRGNATGDTSSQASGTTRLEWWRTAALGARARARAALGGAAAPFALAALCGILCWTSLASAEASEADKREAAALMLQGDAAAAAGEINAALASYRRADAIMGVPTTRVAVARMLAKTDQLIAARQAAQGVIDLPAKPKEPRAFVDARAEAIRLTAELDKRIPTLLVILAAPAGVSAEVRVDGVRLPAAQLGLAQPRDPGSYRVSATAPGYAEVTEQATLSEGARAHVELRLEPLASDAQGDVDEGPGAGPSGLRIGAYASLGVGVIATGLGVYFALRAGSKRDDSDAAFERCGSPCVDTAPEAAQVRDLDASAESLHSASTLSFVLGGVGLASGVVLFLISGDDPDARSGSAQISPWIGPGSAGIFGRF